MAWGYAIALCLEAAGVSGLILALVMGRLERRARTASLSNVLRSGGPAVTGGGRSPREALRIVSAPAIRLGQAGPFVDARTALARALPARAA